MTQINIVNVAKAFKGLPHQVKALEMLQEMLEHNGLTNGDVAWVTKFREKAPTPKQVNKQFGNSWEGIESAARAAGAKFPEVVAAQWALESGFGKYTSGKNNFFGIKGTGTIKTTWEDYGNGPVTIKASFLNFATPYDCVEHLVTQWYKDYKGYKGVNRATTREECAILLKREGYATDPIYSQKLIKLMQDYD